VSCYGSIETLRSKRDATRGTRPARNLRGRPAARACRRGQCHAHGACRPTGPAPQLASVAPEPDRHRRSRLVIAETAPVHGWHGAGHSGRSTYGHRTPNRAAAMTFLTAGFNSWRPRAAVKPPPGLRRRKISPTATLLEFLLPTGTQTGTMPVGGGTGTGKAGQTITTRPERYAPPDSQEDLVAQRTPCPS
jgi:hypothetical protein